jgi:hypothetical protein
MTVQTRAGGITTRVECPAQGGAAEGSSTHTQLGILRENTDFKFAFHNLGTVQNLAAFASRGKYTSLFLVTVLSAYPNPVRLQNPHPRNEAGHREED